MARVASVLGLIMLSVALLILSLISYVSLKKESIFTTPKYANPGAPRMYMLHAGFRSQFALKLLDSSLVPFPHSVTHELQARPKWTFNRTAFLHQRQEILQHVDVIKNFSLTKNSVRIGQLMHYDYSSHKYVFSISNNFRSLLPDVSPIVNKRYNICAVVGNSGILTGSRCGPQIDKSDFVFRCNFAPTEAFQRDVGRKTNLTTFNPSILEKYYNNLLTIQDRNNFFLSLKKLDGAILWIPAFFFHTSATVTRTLVDFFVEHRGQLKLQLAWPGNIMQHVNRYWKNKHLSPKRLSTGLLNANHATGLNINNNNDDVTPEGYSHIRQLISSVIRSLEHDLASPQHPKTQPTEIKQDCQILMPESDDARPAVLLNQTDPPSSPLRATKQAQLDASSRLCSLPEQVRQADGARP
ncbi:hypothetical protein E5288_WYG021677 [Bos mutus]|uniref:Sia-alpha-2,3-Gal-beta-1,4-GlcNAc-R:alpha 2,8-sialyltransferase n=1 Tax=Bos mutus TaxID=72004 RepID=A0A6B0S1J6_9CETA|nr:hypothetical protein [Bos mutus]